MKRIVIFAHYDRDGQIDDYVIHYLRALTGVVNRILFVSDCRLAAGETQKLDGLAELVSAYHHGEYDFGSWKRGFAHLEYDVAGWDELIIANDSCFAPLFPFSEAFALIGACDFWGASKESDSFVVAEIEKWKTEGNGDTPHTDRSLPAVDRFDFVNSYFMVFRKSVLANPAFMDFWRNVTKLEDKGDVIKQFEIGLSRLLLSLGYKFCCFVVRGPSIIYDRFEICVPPTFNLPWLRTLICKENREGVERLSAQLDSIEYPRRYIDRYVERMIGTAKPPHYFLEPEKKGLLDNLRSIWRRPDANQTYRHGKSQK